MLRKKRPINAPPWAAAKVRFYLATCWAADLHTECPDIQGITWFQDKLLLLCVWFHGLLIQPFFPDRAEFPITVLEEYVKENTQ